jgi:hypothetical protein
MFGRKRRAAQALESDEAKTTADRAAEVAAAVAGRTRQAGRAAAPVVRKGAHNAAERAAVLLSETADRLAASETAATARDKLADSAEALAGAVRPKRKRRLRKLLRLGVVAAAVYALVKSPLRGKLAAKFSGHSEPEPELEPITLPAEPRRREPASSSTSNGHAPKTKKPEASGSPAHPE